MGIPALLLFLLLAQKISGLPNIENSVLSKMAEFGVVDVLIQFNATSTSTVISAATFGREFETRDERIQGIFEALTAHATRTQERTLKALRENSENPEDILELWITNQVYVRGFNSKMMKALEDTDAALVKLHPHLELPLPTAEVTASKGYNGKPTWGVNKVRAPQVWAQGVSGNDVIVASIDTGVRRSHEALINGYRTLHGWMDAVHGKPEPYDDNGHGTHVMATAVGKNGVGVAPDAKWIACKGCNKNGQCPFVALIQCAQFVLCPQNPTGKPCTGAAHVVSNAYGGGPESSEFKAVVDAWRMAGITALFSVGNYGPVCRSASRQAQIDGVISVGAVDENSKVAAISSRGPNWYPNPPLLPTIAAPGIRVRSASHAGDDVYVEMSGTDMSCPHAAGVVALLLSKKTVMTPDKVLEALKCGADHTNPTYEVCGGISDTGYPNNHVGSGMVNAEKTLAAPCAP